MNRVSSSLESSTSAADRRLGGSHQQSVVAAGIQADDGRGSESAEAVGFEPFAAEGGIEVAAGFLVELNHDRSRSLP